MHLRCPIAIENYRFHEFLRSGLVPPRTAALIGLETRREWTKGDKGADGGGDRGPLLSPLLVCKPIRASGREGDQSIPKEQIPIPSLRGPKSCDHSEPILAKAVLVNLRNLKCAISP